MSDREVHGRTDYRDPAGLVRLLTWALALEGLSSLACGAMQLRLGSPAFGAVPMEGSEFAALLSVAVTINLVGWLLAGGVYVAWVRRIVLNSRRLKARVIYRSPWSGAWLFVPIAHLWMPFVVAADLWRGTHSESCLPRRSPLADVALRLPPRFPPLIVAWWATRVGSGLWLCLGPLPLVTGRDLPALMLIGMALGVAAMILQVLVAREITAQQQRQFEHDGLDPEDVPPLRAS